MRRSNPSYKGTLPTTNIALEFALHFVRVKLCLKFYLTSIVDVGINKFKQV